jgi:hypothetical protein
VAAAFYLKRAREAVRLRATDGSDHTTASLDGKGHA